MLDGASAALLTLGGGLAGLVTGWWLIRSSGADPRTGRRLAGARAIPLPELRTLAGQGRLPTGPVRVRGRVRCANPIVTAGGDQLAAEHRDTEVRLADGGWRVIERVREARLIDLWERTASAPLDLAHAAEPLITIPQVWEGPVEDLGPSFRPALARLAAEGTTPTTARAVTRQLALVDQLIVLVMAEIDEAGHLRLLPPPGGYLVANVELDTAMRLLGGPRRGRLLAGYAAATAGVGATILGLIGWLLARLA